MITKAYSSIVYGVDAQTISIEVNIVNGTKFFIVGLPDSAIKESEQRIESVLKHLDMQMPRRRVIVNLAPASLKKEGAAHDLPIALAILAASHQVHLPLLSSYIILGELALDGVLRPIKGVLPMALEAKAMGFSGLLVPHSNAQEAAIVTGLKVIGIKHIQEAIAFLSGKSIGKPCCVDPDQLFCPKKNHKTLDLSDVKGQLIGKRSLEVAAAGGHNLLMIGPPGAGKTMLAKCLPSILPRLSLQESLETSKMYSVTGRLLDQYTLVTERPFVSPHHTISDVALVGGGSIPQPGEISMAHHGVLFLDELPEFKRSTLEVLRLPLEEKRITVTRAKLSVTFPANFMLVASMNPCPCGYYTHPKQPCTCAPHLRRRYINKISGPLLDRIDIQIPVQPVTLDEITLKKISKEDSNKVRKRVEAARERQQSRFDLFPDIHNNAMMPHRLVQKFCRLPLQSASLLQEVMNHYSLSARAYNSICTLARTIADLDASESILASHIAEAVTYRSLDRASWGEQASL